jgi:hypothetical protein
VATQHSFLIEMRPEGVCLLKFHLQLTMIQLDLIPLTLNVDVAAAILRTNVADDQKLQGVYIA